MTTLSEIKNVETLFNYLANHNLAWSNENLKKVYSDNQILIRSWKGHKRDLYKFKRVSKLMVMTDLYYIFPGWLKTQGIKMSLISIDAELNPEEKGRVYKLTIYYKDGREITMTAFQEAYDYTCASDKENAENRIDNLSLLGIPDKDMCYFKPIDGSEKIFAFKIGSDYYAIES